MGLYGRSDGGGRSDGPSVALEDKQNASAGKGAELVDFGCQVGRPGSVCPSEHYAKRIRNLLRWQVGGEGSIGSRDADEPILWRKFAS